MNSIRTFSETLTFRILIVGILALALLIPVSMVREVINDREHNRADAIADIYSKWGAEQTIAGPILSVPYSAVVTDDSGSQVTITRYAHFLPSELSIDGSIAPEMRSRGIYDTVVYTSDVVLSGTFPAPDFSDLNVETYKIKWNDAFVSVGIPDMRGIESDVVLLWDDVEYDFRPGIRTNDVIRGGVDLASLQYKTDSNSRSIPVIETFKEASGASGVSVGVPAQTLTREVPFSLLISLNGSDALQFIPVGRRTNITLSSDWESPKFNGAFLPDEREVSEAGFSAQWEVLDLNRNYPQQWTGATYGIYSSVFGVELLASVDQYHKSTRSAKYALLIIALTFLVYLSAEIFNRHRVHLVQYLLIGLALVLFYSLLVSLSEVVGFDYAYLISSIATIGLITFYARSVLKRSHLVATQSGVLTFLYGFVYILLQLEDFALLVGSVGLFAILATVMYLSRNVDWFTISER